MKRFSKCGTIMIVDDMDLNRTILREMFKTKYEIGECCNGQEAIECMKQHHDSIVMVLLDIRMPIMDGYGFLEYMHGQDYAKMIPVILITSDDDGNALERGYAFHVADVLLKPFKASVVIQRVENVIELYSHKNHLEELVKIQTFELQQQYEKLKQQNEKMMDLVREMITYRNVETQEHILYVEGYSKIIASHYAMLYPRSKMTQERIAYIAMAARMHDMGKITMPDLLMKRQGKLLPDEISYLREHTIRGSEMMEGMYDFQSKMLYKILYNVCRYHHEKYDGSGYPEGLKGDRIPIEAQIVGLADMYDALVNVTANKKKIPSNQAVAMLLQGVCGELSPRMKECLVEAKQDLEAFVVEKETICLKK